MGLFSRKCRDPDDWSPRAYWSSKSAKDPRFNMQGGASSTWSAMTEVDKAIRAKAAELGIDPPDDIEIAGGKS